MTALMLAILDAAFILKLARNTLRILTGHHCQLSRDDDWVKLTWTVCGIVNCWYFY